VGPATSASQSTLTSGRRLSGLPHPCGRHRSSAGRVWARF
jgi:hypothetical protein